jgi:hypothetical protein
MGDNGLGHEIISYFGICVFGLSCACNLLLDNL